VSLVRFAWRNILGDGFRSLAVFSCATIVASMALIATFIVRGAEAGLHQNLQRMGADILVLPWGTIIEKIGGARMMSAAVNGWMPRAYIEKIGALEGVARVSPQLYLASLTGLVDESLQEAYLVAFDPATDFTLTPWAEENVTVQELKTDQAIIGNALDLPMGGDPLHLFGQDLLVKSRLESTGTDIDSTIFVSFDTAERLAESSLSEETPIEMSYDKISALMVEVKIGHDPHKVAVRILESVPGAVPLETPDLFQVERVHMVGVLRTLLGILVGVWGLAVVFIGLVFAIVVNDRQRDIGVLMALGSPGVFIRKVLLLEGLLLAAAGGTTGVLLTGITLYSLGERVSSIVNLPLVLPTPLGLAGLSLFGQLLTVGSVAVAAYLPAWLISRKEAALVMRA
jgi:putative ABC transport system permease protein